MTMKNLNEPKLKIFQEIGNKISVIRKKNRKKITGASRKLNITSEHLNLIELGQVDKIPKHIPLIGFIRAYAKHVGVDVSEELGKLNTPSNQEETPQPKQSLNLIKAFFILVVIFSLLLIFLFLF